MRHVGINNSSDGMVFTFGSNSAIKIGGLEEEMRTISCDISNQEIVIGYMLTLFAVIAPGRTINRKYSK
jgi:hypothetical protein